MSTAERRASVPGCAVKWQQVAARRVLGALRVCAADLCRDHAAVDCGLGLGCVQRRTARRAERRVHARARAGPVFARRSQRCTCSQMQHGQLLSRSSCPLRCPPSGLRRLRRCAAAPPARRLGTGSAAVRGSASRRSAAQPHHLPRQLTSLQKKRTWPRAYRLWWRMAPLCVRADNVACPCMSRAETTRRLFL